MEVKLAGEQVKEMMKDIIAACLYDFMEAEDAVDLIAFISEWVDKYLDPISKEEPEKESNANTL